MIQLDWGAVGRVTAPSSSSRCGWSGESFGVGALSERLTRLVRVDRPEVVVCVCNTHTVALMDRVVPLGAWYDISWQDWVGVGGTLLGVAGLVFTFLQAREAKQAAQNAETAANATSKAIERTQAQLRANLQLVQLPALQRASLELDDAIERRSAGEARGALDRWRFQASHVSGLLQEEAPRPTRVLKAITESVVLASVATELLLTPDSAILESCKQARQAISAACNEVTQLVGRNITQVPTTETESTS